MNGLRYVGVLRERCSPWARSPAGLFYASLAVLDPGLEAYCEDDQRPIAKEVFDVLTKEEQAPFRQLSALHLRDEPDANGEFARLEPPASPVRLTYIAPPAVYVTAFLEVLRRMVHRRGMVIPVTMRPILFVPVLDHAALTPLEDETRARELLEVRLADVENRSNEGVLRSGVLRLCAARGGT